MYPYYELSSDTVNNHRFLEFQIIYDNLTLAFEKFRSSFQFDTYKGLGGTFATNQIYQTSVEFLATHTLLRSCKFQ